MRLGIVLCLTLVAVCLALQPDGQANSLGSKGEPVAGDRPTEVKIPAVPFWHVEVKPQPVSIPAAEYPEAARKAHIEGLVVVEALVDVDGSTADTRILRRSRNRSLDEAALAAAREAKFSPAKSRDPAVQVWVTIPYRFILASGKGTAPPRSVSSVTTEPRRSTGADVRSHNDSVLKPLHGLKFIRLKPIAPRDGAHGRMVPDSAAIRFNNEAMMAAGVAFGHRRGDSLRKPPSYYLRSDWYYLVIDSGRCRVFQRNHPHYPSSRAAVYDIDTLMVKPGSLDTNYLEIPDWTTLPQYVPLRLEFDGRVSRTIQAPTFRLEVR